MKRLPRGDELEWRVDVTPGGIQLPIDARDLEDLFGNLLDNARKWARTRVHVTVARDDAAVQIMIEDDGPGIPVERIEDVLARGERLDRTVPGSGMGLAIAKDLAELHGGTLRLGASALGGVQTTVSLATNPD
jgi:signal transduction histidine kinase